MHLFTYGSLMFAPVWRFVTGREDPGERATLRGHRRPVVKGETYPALVAVADPAARVDGILRRDLDAADFARLDAFEGDWYRRVSCEVGVAGAVEAAEVYLFVMADRVGDEDWSVDDFARDGLARFLARHCEPDAPGAPGVHARIDLARDTKP